MALSQSVCLLFYFFPHKNAWIHMQSVSLFLNIFLVLNVFK